MDVVQYPEKRMGSLLSTEHNVQIILGMGMSGDYHETDKHSNSGKYTY